MVRKVLLVGVIMFAMAMASCRQPEAGPIAIGVRTANDHAPFYIADKFGYYADEGVEADVQLVPSNTEIIEAMQRGDLQVGAAPVTSAIAAIAGGTKIKIVAMTGRGSDGLLVRADSGIESIHDLRGRKIATIRGSILDVPLRQALDQVGLDPDQDVALVYFNKLGDMIQALKTGQVDASSNTEPFMTDAERQGWGKILFYYTAFWPDHPCCVVFARQDLITRRPEALKKVLRAHVRAVEYANAHRRETAEIIVAYLEAFDPDLVEASLAPDKMRIDYAITPEEVAEVVSLMHRYGLIEWEPSIQDVLDTSFLEAVQ
jgi:NitT/TauT family transport system substrate-binding protein